MVPTTDLIAYVVGELAERGLNVTTTALVKFLYLADVEASRLGMPRVSSLSWVLYRYGPYAFEIDDAIRQIAGRDIDELAGISVLGRAYRKYLPAEAGQIAEMPPEDRGIVLRVLDRWAGESLEAILDYVYFETEPMRDAKWLEPLDFGSVRRRQPPVRLADWLARKASPEERQRLAQFKRAFWEKARTATRDTAEASPPPRFDSVYLAGMKASDDSE